VLHFFSGPGADDNNQSRNLPFFWSKIVHEIIPPLHATCLHYHIISELMTLVVLDKHLKLQKLNCGNYRNYAIYFLTLTL